MVCCRESRDRSVCTLHKGTSVSNVETQRSSDTRIVESPCTVVLLHLPHIPPFRATMCNSTTVHGDSTIRDSTHSAISATLLHRARFYQISRDTNRVAFGSSLIVLAPRAGTGDCVNRILRNLCPKIAG